MLESNIDNLIGFANDLGDLKDKLFDLWSWLPSHAMAEEVLGDYSSEGYPGGVEVCIEACVLLSLLKQQQSGGADAAVEIARHDLERFRINYDLIPEHFDYQGFIETWFQDTFGLRLDLEKRRQDGH